MSDDYINKGGIRSDLDILQRPPPASLNPQISIAPKKKDELYLHGYGRQWGEKLTYSVGVAYGSSILLGGAYGLAVGLQKGGATPKLVLNSVLNSCSHYGPALANRAAPITMFYVGFNGLVSWGRGSDDMITSAISGMLAGGLYKITSSWRSAIKYSAATACICTSVDYGFKNGYI